MPAVHESAIYLRVACDLGPWGLQLASLHDDSCKWPAFLQLFARVVKAVRTVV